MNKFYNCYYLILLFTAFMLNCPLTVKAGVTCDGYYACAIIEDKDKNNIDFFIRNILNYDITVTIEFSKLENIRASVSLPYTVTIPGDKTVRVMTLQREDINKAWEYYYNYRAVDGNLEAKHDNKFVYSLPYASGSSYMVTQGFNGKYSHTGEQKYSIDWGMPEGTEIYAARGGIVVGIKNDSSSGGDDKKYSTRANYIIIKQSDGTFGAYLHLKKNGAKVSPGQKINTGDLIGLSGNTGWSGGPHLHFWVYKAKNGKERESFPIRFKTDQQEATILLQGNYYKAP